MKIELKELEFFAHHGVMPHERKVGNRFTLSLTIYFDAEKAMESDHLSDTINYAEIYQLLKEEMATPSNLLEFVAGRILRRIGNDFPTITAAEITLTKCIPPIKGFQGKGITFTARRDYQSKSSTLNTGPSVQTV